MEPAVPPTRGKRLWHILRVVCYMLRKGISKQKLMMDLQLLVERGKIAGKSLVNLMTFHHHHHHHHHGSASSSGGAHHSSFSCRSMDPNMSYYEPRAVEFSCSNTPAYPTTATKRKNRHQRHHGQYKYDAAAIAKAFEILNSDITDGEPVMPSPSPALVWGMGKSPRMVRPLRITDSPFPIKEEEEVADDRIDKEAEEFIRRFYEKLRLQQLIPATPEYSCRRAQLVGRS